MAESELENIDPEKEEDFFSSFLFLYLFIGISAFGIALNEGENFTRSVLYSISIILGYQFVAICFLVPLLIYTSLVDTLGFSSITEATGTLLRKHTGGWMGFIVLGTVLAYYFSEWVLTSNLLYPLIGTPALLIFLDLVKFFKKKFNTAG